MKELRADKLAAESLGISRQDARKLIWKGQVEVNGRLCKKIDEKFLEGSVVTAAGRQAVHQEFIYLMLNKPRGVVSASRDPRQTTVVDLVRDAYPRRQLFPAGRLDKDSEGFVLLTDDGAFAHEILAPKHHIPKTYRVTLDTPFTEEMQAGFREGVLLADGSRTLSAEALFTQDERVCQVILHEGMYHQIKRMFGRFGAGVERLQRTAMGDLPLDKDLAPGEYRPLKKYELEQIACERS